MPRLVNRYPLYKLHKPSGRGRTRHQGKDIWFPGKFNSPQSLRAYADFIDRLKTGEPVTAGEKSKEPPRNLLTIPELVEKFRAHCLVHYRRNGEPTGEAAVIRCALQPLLELFGDGEVLAAEFRPRHLKMVREEMIRRSWSRRYINRSVGRIKRLFNWATENEYVPEGVSGAIAAVRGLEAHRSMAREKPKIEPVADEVIAATLPELPKMIADMIRIARLCGQRPGELLRATGAEIDRRDPTCWVHSPRFHKNSHRGKERKVPLGPPAIAILAPYVMAAGDSRIFPYTVSGFRQAIVRACDRAFPHPALSTIEPDELTTKQRTELLAWRKAHRWHPNRLRHSAATAIREEHGRDGAQAVLGHASGEMTENYADVSFELAKRVARNMTLGKLATG
jgi:integrase